PAVQAITSTARADEVARRANDYLAEQVARRPDRFQAFAALPLQDPELAIRELERCVTTLGFRGALVNGFSQVSDNTPVYYDLPQYWPFWAKVEELGIPFYLHPRNPLPADSRIYDGHPWLLGPTWAFGQETAVHALRLIGSGLFDAHPKLQIILGHMGEGLPYSMWRIDHRNAWVKAPHKHKALKIESRVWLMNMSGSSAMRSCARFRKAKDASVVTKEPRRVLVSTAQHCFLG